MNIHMLSRLFKKEISPQDNFKEKRLVLKGVANTPGASERATIEVPESPPQNLERAAAIARAQEAQKKAADDIAGPLAEAVLAEMLEQAPPAAPAAAAEVPAAGAPAPAAAAGAPAPAEAAGIPAAAAPAPAPAEAAGVPAAAAPAPAPAEAAGVPAAAAPAPAPAAGSTAEARAEAAPAPEPTPETVAPAEATETTPAAPEPAPAPESAEPATKPTELTSEQQEFIKKSPEEKLKAAGFEIKDGKIIFKIEDSERSFKYTKTQIKKLNPLLKKATSAEQVKLIIYQHLLEVILKDESFHTNTYRVTNFRQSNEMLVYEITRLEELLKLQTGQTLSTEQLKAIKEKAIKELTKLIFGELEIKSDGTTPLKDVYSQWETKFKWTDKNRPFSREEFYRAGGLDENGIVARGVLFKFPFLSQINTEEPAAAVPAAPAAPAAAPAPAAPGTAPAPAASTAAAETPKNPLLEQLRSNYFSTYDSVEETTRTILPGKYQLRKNTLIYKKGRMYESDHEQGKFQFFEIKDSTIYKITKNGKSIYVAKAEDFKWKNPAHHGTLPVQSPGEYGTIPGFINIEDIIVEDRQTTPQELRREAQIESDWTQENPTLQEDEQIIPDRVYGLKTATDLFTVSHNPHRHLRKEIKVKIVDEKTRVVEGNTYVQVKVEDTKEKGWILKRDIDIPSEEMIFLSPNERSETPLPEQVRTELGRMGKYQLTRRIRGSELLQILYTQFADQNLQELLEKSGLSKRLYLEALKATMDKNGTIEILIPKKRIAKILSEYARSATNTAYQRAETAERQRIFSAREHYFNDEFFVGGKKKKEERSEGARKLTEYLDNDEKWNDLWSRTGEQSSEIIDGIDRIIAVFQKLGIPDYQVRDELRELVQYGKNDKLTFEEIFKRYVEGKIYDGDFKKFRTELESLESELAPWIRTYGKEGLKALDEYYEALKNYRAIIDNTENPESTPEYTAYKKAGDKKIGKQRVREIAIQFGAKVKKLEDLKTDILEPIAILLDTFTTLQVITMGRDTFYGSSRQLVESLDSIDEPMISVESQPGGSVSLIHQEYFGMAGLASHKEGNPKLIEETDKSTTAIGILKDVTEKFDAIAEKFGIKKGTFTHGDILKIILQIYSLETLADEGCLKKIKGSGNKLILTNLPANFNEKNPEIKKLFTSITSGEKIDKNRSLLESTSKILDNNIRALSRIQEIFGKDDEGLKKHFNWMEKLSAFFSREDTREVTFTMDDIQRHVVKPTGEFLRKYMSGNAATTYLIDQITVDRNGIEIYDHEKLKAEINNRLRIGLHSLFMSDDFKILREKVLAPYGDIDDPETIKKAYADISKKLENFDEPINFYIKAVIGIGEVMYHVLEEKKEKFGYSTHPVIRTIQEKLATTTKYSTEDLQKIESIMLLGLAVGVEGVIGAGGGTEIDLGDGWEIRPYAGISSEGAALGVGVSKTMVLTKDGRDTITYGIHGGFLHIGGDISYKFKISEEIDMGIHGISGISVIGFYTGGGISFRKNTNAKQMDAWREEQEKLGLRKVAELIRDNASPEEIREAMLEIPHYGTKFKALQDNEKFSDEALVEVFKIFSKELESSVTGRLGVKHINLDITGGGAFAGTIDGIPYVSPFVTLRIGEEFVLVRRVMDGYENISENAEAEIQTRILNQFEDNIIQLHTTIGDSGNTVFDTETMQPAILDDRDPGEEIDLSKFDTLAKFKEALERIKINVTTEGNSVAIQAYNHKNAHIKYLIDPTLDTKFSIKNGKVLFVGITAENLKNFIITRENFYYCNETQGVNKLSVITIKKNPLRKRSDIEKESPKYIYEATSHEPLLRTGLAKHGESNIITTEEFTKLPTQGEAIRSPQREDFEQWNERNRRVLNVISQAAFEGEPREGIVEKVKTMFLNGKFVSREKEKGKDMKQLYRELSTIGTATYDLAKLNILIADAAHAVDIKIKLTGLELAQLHIALLAESFMEAKGRMETFKKNLEFAKRTIFIPLFKEAKAKLKLQSTPEEMAEVIGNDLSANLDLSSTTFATLDPGTILLSVVGTMGISGLRGTSYYGSMLDRAAGILNLNQYDPALSASENPQSRVRGDIGRALLETLSPLERDPKNVEEFLKSALARKIGAMPEMYLILGQEDAKKVTDCFETKKVTPANQEAFDKFRKLVLDVRDAQNRGANTIDLPNGFRLRIDTLTGIGVYKKCTNPTMIAQERITVQWKPTSETIATQTNHYIGQYTDLKRRDLEILLDVTLLFREKQEQEQAPRPAAGGGNEARGGTGGTHGGGNITEANTPRGTAGQ